MQGDSDCDETSQSMDAEIVSEQQKLLLLQVIPSPEQSRYKRALLG